MDWPGKFNSNLKSMAYRLFPKSASRVRLELNRRRKADQLRFLEIGPGQEVLPGFERYDIRRTGKSDYVGDACDVSLFSDCEFDLIYASHVLEHVAWYHTQKVLSQWRRILKQGGVLEVWVPDVLKIARAYVEASLSGNKEFEQDGWYRFNDNRSVDLWFAGRIFSYGDGTGEVNDHNWHRAAFSESFLTAMLKEAGFSAVEKLNSRDVRGHDHGWINLGLRAVK